jgi:phospholipid N-methyltransferase
MEFIQSNLSIIIFALSIISLVVKQNWTIQRNQMRIIEIEKDLKNLKEQQDQDSKMINKLYVMLETSIVERKTQFIFIKEELTILRSKY